MEDLITTGYNIILFQLEQQKAQKQNTTILGSAASVIGGTEMTQNEQTVNQSSNSSESGNYNT